MRSVAKSRCPAMLRRHFRRFPEGRASDFRVYVGGTLSHCALFRKQPESRGNLRMRASFSAGFFRGAHRIFECTWGGRSAIVLLFRKQPEISRESPDACIIFGRFFPRGASDFRAYVGGRSAIVPLFRKRPEFREQSPDAYIIFGRFLPRGASDFRVYVGGTLSHCAPISKTPGISRAISGCVHHFRQVFLRGVYRIFECTWGERAALAPLFRKQPRISRAIFGCVRHFRHVFSRGAPMIFEHAGRGVTEPRI